MSAQKETRLGLAPRRASYAVRLTTDASEVTFTYFDIQAARLARHFGLTVAHAQLIAELAFTQPARRA